MYMWQIQHFDFESVERKENNLMGLYCDCVDTIKSTGRRQM